MCALRIVHAAIAASALIAATACGHSTMGGVKSFAFHTDTLEHKSDFKRAHETIAQQMRRCYPAHRHFAGVNNHRIDVQVDEKAQKADIAFYNDGAAYRGYVSVVTVEAISSGVKVTTYSQAQMWQFVHQAVPLWLDGDKEVCPDHFLLGIRSTVTPVYVPVVVRRR